MKIFAWDSFNFKLTERPLIWPTSIMIFCHIILLNIENRIMRITTKNRLVKID